jgi:hypothetical protein
MIIAVYFTDFIGNVIFAGREPAKHVCAGLESLLAS